MVGSRVDHKPNRELKVLALGLPRTGSSSIAEALTILGYKDVLHGFNILDSPEVWSFMNRAADASFATLPTYTGKPFTRKEWDELFGASEAATDVAAVFATQLIEVYPEAKVILVIRDFDKWYRSIEAAVKIFWSFPSQLAFNYLGQFFDPCFGQATKKIITGFFEYTSIGTFPQDARIVYDRHHYKIRQQVPSSRLLEYRMGEGWEPICNFLEKPLPNVPFPWLNEAEALRRRVKLKVRKHLVAALRVLIPWALGTCTMLVAMWMVRTRSGY
ncbi:P-loop containing nucleoside triphosphate hydrolase protein [Daldinia vernicosa]|uniref:P-loop containing nucleoside triphosphate hydrolase protein n=1 Tax=Daldinia vernicosa TaxID=114800 RepID=UPI00200764C7|nr:P-loop containing nucleoside triphosphate hydrolase protein [Daldinia vernicosa]KAI0849531.1 P-loop containing nucleoside triphosphate hydrolase protein [Daldinia vernicosa]